MATGVPLDVFVVNATRSETVDGVRFVKHMPIPASLTRVARLMKMRLVASVPVLQTYDVVFLRYPTAIDLDPLAFVRARSKGPRIATIHHAKEVREQLAISRSPGMLARAGLEWVQGRRIVREVDGIIGVTDEIRDFQLARAGVDKPARTIANGVDVSTVAPTGFVPFDGEELRLVFLASSHALWHGTDRLRKSLEAYRGRRRVVLDMVGRGSNPAGTREVFGNVTIRHHGMLHGEALDRVLAQGTLAISTLAFFRTGLRQAAVLKTREYVARGLPTVLGYEDMDLPEDWPFALRLPIDESVFSLDPLFDFAARVSSAPGAAQQMRRFAEGVLDWRVKVPRFAELAEVMLDRSLC
ncbi:MAG: glycosyltransferase [Labilithrix sp.]|nr:glycosyltransferase [Labilithrix sp.]MCW5814744.1 glycosyltransferase [Labilithrix sp.]